MTQLAYNNLKFLHKVEFGKIWDKFEFELELEFAVVLGSYSDTPPVIDMFWFIIHHIPSWSYTELMFWFTIFLVEVELRSGVSGEFQCELAQLLAQILLTAAEYTCNFRE
jgi:hypothetical protein